MTTLPLPTHGGVTHRVIVLEQAPEPLLAATVHWRDLQGEEITPLGHPWRVGEPFPFTCRGLQGLHLPSSSPSWFLWDPRGSLQGVATGAGPSPTTWEAFPQALQEALPHPTFTTRGRHH